MVADEHLAVDGRVREVLVVAELVDQHVERFGRVAECRPVEEGHALEDVARDGVHPLRPGEPEHAGARPEQQIEDLAGVVEDDGREAVGRGRLQVRTEVRDVDVDGQRPCVEVGRGGGRDRAPRAERRADERDRGRVRQRTEITLIRVVRDVGSAGGPEERLSRRCRPPAGRWRARSAAGRRSSPSIINAASARRANERVM